MLKYHMDIKQMKSGIFLFLIISFFPLYDFLRHSNQWNTILIQISIGFLTFVAIFYSFVLKKEIIAQREQLLSSKWKKYVTPFEEKINALREITKISKPDYNELLNITQEIHDIIEKIAALERETNLNKILYYNVVAYIMTILFLFVDLMTNYTYNNVNIFRLVGFGFLFVAIYKTIELLNSWYLITESKN